MEDGEQVTETPVIVDAEVTVTAADPNLVASCVEVAVTVAVPVAVAVAEAVKTPALLMLPAVDGLTDQVTAEL